MADRRHIVRVLRNLLPNSARHSLETAHIGSSAALRKASRHRLDNKTMPEDSFRQVNDRGVPGVAQDAGYLA